MESNKSKGVEELIQWAATKRKENRESRDITRSPYREIHDGKEKAFGEMVDYLLAHPQQSEGVGQAANGEMVDLLEFAAMNYQPNITSDKQVYWFEDDNETPILSEEIVERYLAEAQPSEPAALKEPQGSAPAVVIADGEIESIAIELISKHGRWADDEMEYQASEYEFTAALKEFASLLTNHKS